MVRRDVRTELLRSFAVLEDLRDESLAALAAEAELTTYESGSSLFGNMAARSRTHFLLSGSLSLEIGEDIRHTVDSGSERARFPVAYLRHQHCLARVASRNAEIISCETALYNRLSTWEQTGHFQVTEIGEGSRSSDASDWMVSLIQSPICRKIPAEHLQQLFHCMTPVRVRANEAVIKQGTGAEYCYVIASGSCKVVRYSPLEGRAIGLATLGPGAVFGEDALIGDTYRNATVTMLSDGTLMRLDKADFDRLCREPVLNWIDHLQCAQLLAEGGQLIHVGFMGENGDDVPDAAIRIPLHTLRLRIPSLRRVPTVVCCDEGPRSSVAAFVLAANGFEAFVLRKASKAPVPREKSVARRSR